ncbi:hypothetical protein [cf. Phormidesmis sp. LEGE 11477]|uniref:hypothetical protein n=1 Tax=cf. Phormidesmis sp. LEGE 11477 TaxID=1828680 RepID=UPI0018822A5F|nr:hypothetical protein [cf. Phormidesmis sp. LEGE 11477]MBE9064265.1 hypothetical protein [cf. Phormidesmis sp. LEGE 11477]
MRVLCLMGLMALGMVIAFALSAFLGWGYAFVFGVCFGLFAGVAFGLVIATAGFNAIAKRESSYIEALLVQLVKPRIVYGGVDPIVVEALGKITEHIVLMGCCGLCGSDHEGLEHDPFNPRFHRTNPRCAVPLARRLYVQYQKSERANEASNSVPIRRLSAIKNKLLAGGR